jgi:hypothetical protein
MWCGVVMCGVVMCGVVMCGGVMCGMLMCGYPLLHPYILHTKNVQRHAVLSWYMYSGVPPSCNSCYVCSHAHTDRSASQ